MSAGKRILIVEDERIIALDLQWTLEQLGYVVVGAVGSSDDALQRAAEAEPDLVLMDIRLDGEADGVQTAALLRARHGIPIVYLTANADPDTLRHALETAPGGFLAKPFQQSTLRSTIEVALRRHELEMRANDERKSLTDRMRELEERSRELEDKAERLQIESVLDPLTRLFNRRHLESVLPREINRAERARHPLGIIFLDLDHFKNINDAFGHSAADVVLQKTADLLRTRVRVYDVVCRYGGEEFLVVVPAASVEETQRLAERLRSSIEKIDVSEGNRAVGPISASFGVAAFPAHGGDAVAILQAADAALYAAKREGRNRVSVAPNPNP